MATGKRKQTALTKPAVKSGNTKPAKARPPVSEDQRYRMIQENAYYLAERAGFNGDSMEHWLTAEREFRERFE